MPTRRGAVLAPLEPPGPTGEVAPPRIGLPPHEDVPVAPEEPGPPFEDDRQGRRPPIGSVPTTPPTRAPIGGGGGLPPPVDTMPTPPRPNYPDPFSMDRNQSVSRPGGFGEGQFGGGLGTGMQGAGSHQNLLMTLLSALDLLPTK